MPEKQLERLLLIAILLAYAGLVVLYATQTPAWQVPDEPAHYNYTRQIAEGGCCPVMAPGDWDAEYLALLTGSGFDPANLDRLDAVQYEDHQPPLYYLLAAPVYQISGGSLIALRLFSALLGAGVIVAVYGIGRAVSDSGPVALGAAAFAAFVPQHLAILSGAGNDALAELIVALGVWLAVLHVRDRGPAWLGRWFVPLLGVIMGLGFLTKASTFLLGPVIGLALVLRWWRESPRQPAALIRAGALFLIPALVIGGVWWARNVSLYGWPDIFGMARHDAVVVGQPRTADWIAREGFGAWLGDGVRITFQSFWGQFGWMGVPMPRWVYTVLLAFTGVSYAGLIPLALHRTEETRSRRGAVLLMIALFGLGIAAFLYYNLSFIQFQGRYLFPAMAAFALAYAGGWAGWAGLLTRRAGWLRWLPAAIMWGLAGLSVLALWRFVIPNLPAW